MLWCLVGPQGQRDIALRGLEDDVIGGHLFGGRRGKRHGIGSRRVADGDARHLYPLAHAPLGVRRRRRDLLHHFQALDDAPENRELPAERELIGDGDEELRAGAVRLARLQYRGDCAAGQWRRVELGAQHPEAARAVECLLRWILRQRIASLDDPHLDRAMERRPIVGALAGQLDEVADMIRRDVGQQLDDERALRRLDDGLLVCHLGCGERRLERRRCGWFSLRLSAGGQGDEKTDRNKCAHRAMLAQPTDPQTYRPTDPQTYRPTDLPDILPPWTPSLLPSGVLWT